MNILMPRLGTNDNMVTIGKWYVQNGDYVKKGTKIAVLETTKETEDLIAECDGYILQKYKRGEDVAVDSVIAVISDDVVEINSTDEPAVENANAENYKLTEKAKELIAKYNIDLSLLPQNKLIREKDVLSIIGNSECSFCRSKANDIIIVSGGGVAKMCIDILRENGGYNISGITDPSLEIGTKVLGVPVIGNDDILELKYKEGIRTAVNAIGGIANSNTLPLFELRKKMYEIIKSKGFFLPNIIHRGAMIESSVEMGEGNLIFAGASIGSNAKIGDDCIINTGAVVSHDCVIESHAKISPGAILAGNVYVGENSLIGMGVTVYIGVKIGKNVIISNGQNIFSDVPDNTIIRG